MTSWTKRTQHVQTGRGSTNIQASTYQDQISLIVASCGVSSLSLYTKSPSAQPLPHPCLLIRNDLQLLLFNLLHRNDFRHTKCKNCSASIVCSAFCYLDIHVHCLLSIRISDYFCCPIHWIACISFFGWSILTLQIVVNEFSKLLCPSFLKISESIKAVIIPGKHSHSSLTWFFKETCEVRQM